MRPFWVIGCLVLVASFSSACLPKPRPAPDITYEDISVALPEQTSSAVDATLLVRRLRVVAPFDRSSFYYKTGDGTFEFDYYYRFIAPPGDLLTNGTREWLDAAGLFAGVIDPRSRLEYRYVAEGTVTELFGDYTGTTPKAVIGMDLTLLDDAEGLAKTLLRKKYRVEVTVESSDQTRYADAVGKALARILENFRQDLGSVLIGNLPTPETTRDR